MNRDRESPAPSGHSSALFYALGLALPVAVTLLVAQFSMPAFVFEHLVVILVVALAVAGGRGPAIAAATTAAIADNILLREPVGQPAITGVRDAVDLALFLAVAMVVGILVDRLRTAKARAIRAAERERAAREALDRMVATVTHDLATPLGAIHGTIQFVRRHAASSEIDLARLLARVETAAARATSLVKAFADARSIEQHTLSLDTRVVDLRAVIEPIVRMLDQLSDRHPIAFAVEDTPVTVSADVDRLRGVVENLLMNAIKYSPAGGTIEVCLRTRAGAAVLMVRDHGIGLPEGGGRRLFEFGYRAPEAVRVAPGLGLGLFTAAEVLRRHQGTIAACAAEGGGSVFTVRLPLASSALASASSDDAVLVLGDSSSLAVD